MTALDASTRGRRNRANGADCERKVARYLAPWWPDAVRAVRNTQPDPGDIANTGPDKWWSVKNCQVERIEAWMAEVREKAADRIGLLVVRRRGYADPGRWWCWLEMGDLAILIGGEPGPSPAALVRLELATVIPLLPGADPAAT